MGLTVDTKYPSYACEMSFLSFNLLMYKFYKVDNYVLLSFFSCLLPMMAYAIGCMFLRVLKFVQLL